MHDHHINKTKRPSYPIYLSLKLTVRVKKLFHNYSCVDFQFKDGMDSLERICVAQNVNVQGTLKMYSE